MIQQYRDSNQVIWFDEELIEDPSQPIFDAEYWQSTNKVTGSASGRGTTWFVQLDTMQAALRHYRRGGLFGKLVKTIIGFQVGSKRVVRKSSNYYLH